MRRRIVALSLLLPLGSAAAQTWTLREEQRFVDEERAPFSRPGFLTVLRSGEVVVSDFAEKSLVRFAPDGRFVSRIGRSGKGPGEFESPTLLGRIGDTLWVADQALQRTSFFGPDGKFVRTSTYRLVAPSLGGIPGTPNTILIDGSAVGTPSVAARPEGPDSVPVLHVRPSQIRPDTLAMISMRNTNGAIETSINGARGPMFFGQPLGSAARVHAVPNGRGVLIADYTDAPSRESARVRMARYGPDARLLWRRDWRYEPEPLTSAQFDSVTRAFAAMSPPGVSRDQLVAALYRPNFWAPFIGGFVAEDESIWFAERDRAGARAYRIFTAEGAPAARVSVPAGAILRYATTTHVWGWLIEDDLPVLVRWRIDRGR